MEPDDRSSRKTLRIATLNVWALPYGISRDDAARFRAIGEALPALELDAVGLQEVWRPDASEALTEGGRRAGLVYSWHSGATFTGGGLLLLSRHPLRDLRFQSFTLRGIPEHLHRGDYSGGKGFVLATLDTPAGSVALVDTHLHAQYTAHQDDIYLGYRTGQVVELALALREVTQPVVAVGDFNMREGRPEHAIFEALSGLRDQAAALDRRAPTTLADNPYRDAHVFEPESRIDYVFSRPGLRRGLRALSVERVFDEALEFEQEPGAYSDHAGVLAEFALEGPGQTLAPIPSDAVPEASAILRASRLRSEARQSDRRALAGAAGVAAGGSILALRNPALRRRRFLQWLVAGGAVLALSVGTGALALSEIYAPRDLRAHDEVLSLLEAVEAQER